MELSLFTLLRSEICFHFPCCYHNFSAIVTSGFHLFFVNLGKIQGIANWSLYLIYRFRLFSFHCSCLRVIYLIIVIRPLVCFSHWNEDKTDFHSSFVWSFQLSLRSPDGVHFLSMLLADSRKPRNIMRLSFWIQSCQFPRAVVTLVYRIQSALLVTHS